MYRFVTLHQISNKLTSRPLTCAKSQKNALKKFCHCCSQLFTTIKSEVQISSTEYSKRTKVTDNLLTYYSL